MKKNIILLFAAIPLMGAFFSLMSFGSGNGGEGFEIFLNEQVVCQKFGKDLNNVASIDLSKASPDDELRVRYYHCGTAGTNRKIMLKDAQDRVIKVWDFSAVKTNETIMSCKVKEIPGYNQVLAKSTIKLYYSSSIVPNGRQLASIGKKA